MTKNKNMDIRAIRTRKQIMTALMDLLKKKNFESIRVADITAEAMINRATFYNYFTDKYQLLEAVTKEILLVDIQKDLASSDFSIDLLEQIYLLLTDFHLKMSNFCSSNYEELSTGTDAILRQEVRGAILKSLQVSFPNEADEDLDSFARILSWTIFGLAYEWQLSRKDSPQAYFARFRKNLENMVQTAHVTEH
ncbi:TetR/AcrR family transcriptional regulator [Aerococcus agrisoli]|uniref:TetR/AcrR family transcriptional regulator n=1 Tax=Aerococcus agrisoli TaxID=2487350 RepID=A0A3N4GJ43_9LACT|nr:TetR/AcrR family transcriptional regulator [Aerococcus agrisoli]RPA58660.1 TetR/AcrR family transcriptional regulator [Aerococcus agrisoli]